MTNSVIRCDIRHYVTRVTDRISGVLRAQGGVSRMLKEELTLF